MAEITYSLNNDVLTIFAEGHIDSSNAEAVSGKIDEALKSAKSKIIFDADKLTYISSVGLRMLLKIKKTFNDFEIVNTSSEVYEVLEMTGFTEMMKVSKGYRHLSIDGCEAIGQGSNGVVYRLDADTIIKVYRNPDSLPDIERERDLAKKAFVLGIPTAIPYDIVKVSGSYGSVFELLNAKSFAKIVSEDESKLDEITKEFVKLLKLIHSTEVKKGDMPEMKSVALKWAKDLIPYLPNDDSTKLVSLISAVPEKDTMLHGDYHFKNVMVQNGEVLLIDMDTLCVGHPVFEFASIYLANVGFGEVDENVTLKFMGLPYSLTTKIWQKTLEEYFGTTDKAVLDSYANKAKIIGYTRLLRRTIRREPENVACIENCKKNLHELLKTVDSLDF